MRRIITCSVVCLFMLAFYCGCLERENGSVVTMTMKEFTDDDNSTYDVNNKTIYYFFESLDGGDTLLIKDTIYNVSYKEDKNYTLISFESLSSTSSPIAIYGDITDNFTKGDKVEVKIHIIDFSYTDIDPDTNETWIIEIETYEEGYDKETHTFVPFPQTVIRHA